MKSVSIRDLRYDFPKVEELLAAGETVRLTRRRKVIARLVPEPAKAIAMPDFLADLKEIYGDQLLPVTGAEIVRVDRDRF